MKTLRAVIALLVALPAAVLADGNLAVWKPFGRSASGSGT
jgi:hypothetical protein